MSGVQHLWLVEGLGQPSPLAEFLAAFPTPFGERDDWSPNMVLNDVTVGFSRLVVAASRTPSQLISLAEHIARNPQRLRAAVNRLAVIAPFPPYLAEDELARAGITVKYCEPPALPFADAGAGADHAG